MPDYTCDAVTNAFIQQSGLLGGKIYSKAAPSGPWIASTPRGEWKDGMGLVQNNLLWERSVPTDDGDEWIDAAMSNGTDTDNCSLTPELLEFGQTERSMALQRRNIQTQEFCVEDLRTDYQIEQVAQGIDKNLTWASQYVWETRNRAEYIRLSDHKITENGSFNINGTSFVGSAPPTSRLTWGTLEQIYNWLIIDGAGVEGSVGRTAQGRPVFDLFTDANTARDLIRQDPDLREDFRFAFQGQGINSPLLAGLGAGQIVYNGFRIVFDPFPQRYDLSGNTMVRRTPYTTASTTKGIKQPVDPRYVYAATQISVIHVPTVYRQLVPRPITAIGSMKFNPVNYMGDFQFLNIRDKVCNPRGTKGFFDAVFASASEPGDTNFGFAIWHLSCPPLRTLRASCYS